MVTDDDSVCKIDDLDYVAFPSIKLICGKLLVWKQVDLENHGWRVIANIIKMY